MTCQNKGYNVIARERGIDDEDETCFWSNYYSMPTLFIVVLIPSKSFVSLISDKKVEDANFLTKRKITKCFLTAKMLENSQYLPMFGSSEFYEWMRIIRLITSK